MNIFTNVRANTMHDDKNHSNFDFIFSNPMFKSTPTYGSQYMMMSHSKGYDTHEDIILAGNLRIHVPCT